MKRLPTSPRQPSRIVIIRPDGDDRPCAVRLIYDTPPPVAAGNDVTLTFIPEFGAMAAVSVTRSRQFSIQVIKLRKSQLLPFSDKCLAHLHPLKYRYRGEVFSGETLEQHIYFIEPIRCFSPPPIGMTVGQALANWTEQLRNAERIEIEKQANLRAKENAAANPKRLPHEHSEMDHYQNQREVMLQLLAKTWPKFADAKRGLDLATTEAEKARCRDRVRRAYVADHKKLCGACPDGVTDKEFREWLDDESFAEWWSDAYKKIPNPISRMKWELAHGWIKKGYYGMHLTELEKAFRENTGETNAQGEALRKCAERLGLLSAVPPGRPEKNQFNDSAS